MVWREKHEVYMEREEQLPVLFILHFVKKYLFQDLHGKYVPRLSTLNLPHLENLKKNGLL